MSLDKMRQMFQGGQRTRHSALYCRAMAKKVWYLTRMIYEERSKWKVEPGELHFLHDEPDDIMAMHPEGDPASLRGSADEELLRWATNLLKLHQRLGHPSSHQVKHLRECYVIVEQLARC